MEREPGGAETPGHGARFGDVLRRRRELAGLSQEELAERAGLSVKSIGVLERGERRRPHPHTIELLARALGLEAEERRALVVAAMEGATPPSSAPTPADAPRESQIVPHGHATPRHNLPIQLTSFVGRERELAELALLLTDGPRRARLLTLTGIGGCGKTRLALEAVGRVIEAYADGVWLVELAPLADPSLVAATIARTLGVREEPPRPILATLVDFLRARRCLVLLDNCEHLIDACARASEAVLQAGPGVTILATSREALGLAGEVAWRVPSLPLPPPRRDAGTRRRGEAETVTATSPLRGVPSLEVGPGDAAGSEAVRLFVERARGADPGFALTAENAPVVAQICRRLDGIPLAIELAAARLKVLSLDQIATRLDDRFRLLTGGSRTALPRQQTLRATLDWSYNLLSAPERRLLRRLSVFASGGTLDAVEAVYGDAGDALDLLSQLFDKSLVAVEKELGEPRYRLLETIRQYGHERLVEAEEAHDARERHRDWYLRLVERAEPELIGPRQGAWLDRLEEENDNLRTALEWTIERGTAELGLRLAGALGWLWTVRDYWSEGRAWLERALAAPGAERQTAARAKALDNLGIIAHLLGDFAAMRRAYDECLEICQELGDRRRSAWTVRQLAYRALDQREPVLAEALFTGALGQAQEVGDRWVVAQALEGLGLVAIQRGDFSPGRELLAKSLEHFRATGDLRAIGTSLWLSGKAAAEDCDYAAAGENLRESLAILRSLRSKARVTIVLWELALVTHSEGDSSMAHALLDEGLLLARTIGVRWLIVGALTARALIARAEGHLEAAQEFAREAMTSACEGDPGSRGRARSLSVGGILAIERGEYRHGVRLLGAAASHEADRLTMLVGEYRAREDALALARARIGAEAVAEANAEGKSMTLDQALAYALED